MRKSILYTFAAALILIALPSLADTTVAADQPLDQEVTLEQIFEAEAASVETTEAPVEAVTDGEEPLFLASGESCGGTICGKGTYCCNASCGWCRPYGMSCIQIACN